MAIALSTGKWVFNDYKIVKVIGAAKDRIAFQRKGNKYTRGLSISKDAFMKMEDVTITPGMKIELEPNVFLSHYGKSINLLKVCHSTDSKQCNGGFFSFTLREWQQFWTKMRQDIIAFLQM